MKKDLKKSQIIGKALDALKKQALRDDEIKKIKGGTEIPPGQTVGMWCPDEDCLNP